MAFLMAIMKVQQEVWQTMNWDIKLAMKEIRKYKFLLSTQQMRTLKGQVINGHIDAAMKGLNNLVGRLTLDDDK